MVKFLRRTGDRYSKLGKGRKKKQKWRRPTGRDNKMREKRKGYPAVVKIGYKQDKKSSGMLENSKKPVMIMNVKDLEKIKKNEIGIIGNIGKKKKIEIANIAKEKKIEFKNLNVKKFLKKIKKSEDKKKEKIKSTKKEEKSKEKKKEKAKSEKKKVEKAVEKKKEKESKSESKPKIEKHKEDTLEGTSKK